MATLNFNKELLNFDKTVSLKNGDDNGNPLTYKAVAVAVLLAPNKREEQRQDGFTPPDSAEKEKRLDLAERIQASTDEGVRITSEETVKLKQLVADAYGVLVVGQFNRFVES